MKIFVYEWASGGGGLDRDQLLPQSLRHEGASMLAAVAGDFAALTDVEVSTITDASCASPASQLLHCHQVASAMERERLFDQLAATSDVTVVIAPEFDGILLRLSARVQELGGRLLSPGPGFVEVASDKQSTAEHLHRAGVRVPRGTVLMPGEQCPSGSTYPAVVKPVDGCGSLGVRLVGQGDLAAHEFGAYRLEELISGQAASVALVCGANQIVALEPCLQKLTSDGHMAYSGGKLPLPPGQPARAIQLATAAIQALPPCVGYVGVDIVLGDAEDGSKDVIIEVNPRYTTSYVGLRAATDANLAALCLDVAAGKTASAPLFTRNVEWDSSGQLLSIEREDQ